MSGLELLNPLGLLALAALVVPLLIHLFRRSRGRRVPVGNIALYRHSRQLQVLEPRLQQWLLFLVRALLVVLTALLLAGLSFPFVEHFTGSTAYASREWLAVPGRDVSELDRHDRAFVLAEGFPVLGAEPTETGGVSADLWSLLARRLAGARHDGDVHVYAMASARQFPAEAPALGGELAWHLDERPGIVTAPALPALDVTLRYSPDRESDARMIAAALDLLADRRRVDLRHRLEALTPAGAGSGSGSGSGQNDERRRVLICLGGDRSCSGGRFAAVLRDTAATPGAAQTLRLDQAPASRFRVRPAPGPDGTVLWRTDSGTPLLIVRPDNGTQHLTFLDRLTPRDNGLLNSEAFPDLLLRLLVGESGWAAASEGAPADPAPAVARAAPALRAPRQSLAPWLALAMAFLLAIERWMSERPPRGSAP